MKNIYFYYLIGLVDGGCRPYQKLFSTLDSSIFLWDDATPLDKDRALDGIELRSRYESDTGRKASTPYNTKTASILEVLVALSLRIDNIMSEYGEEKPGYWFLMMIENLGLSKYKDDNFDEEAVRHILTIWRDKLYEPNGNGGLFPLKNPSKDQRLVPIWDQASEYLNENF